jgi:hypothetical protein
MGSHLPRFLKKKVEQSQTKLQPVQATVEVPKNKNDDLKKRYTYISG